jgi:membrane protease YdiL (CAAX protease family)
MNDNGSSIISPAAGLEPTPMTPLKRSALETVFMGPNGLRAGWRIAIYILIIYALSAAIHFVRHRLLGAVTPDPGAPMEPFGGMMSRIRAFIVCVIAALVVARLEKEKWGHYGLPVRRALSRDFWSGLVWGLISVSVVMGSLWLAGAYRIDGLALSGTAIWKYAALWAAMFLVVGLLEEFSLRGYLQYALASGIGFWPAAILLSGLFLSGHIGNPGENWMGLADVFIIGMFLAFTLWRTGDLWFAVGLHAAWDWGLTYLYSVPNSGTTAVGHLFNIRTQGPNWLTGGTAGPEGSVINLAFDLLLFIVFALIYRKRKWVGMNDRRQAVSRTILPPQPVALDSSALTT